jgi:hypothetical protein|tara:strand:+ start:372 stop:530 length:159 start_codon:yes stop_codon:yes gene_type:complete
MTTAVRVQLMLHVRPKKKMRIKHMSLKEVYDYVAKNNLFTHDLFFRYLAILQ